MTQWSYLWLLSMEVRWVCVPIEPIRATRAIYFGLLVLLDLMELFICCFYIFSHEQINVLLRSVHCSCVKPGASKGHHRSKNLRYVQLSVLYHASIHLGFTSIPMHNVFRHLWRKMCAWCCVRWHLEREGMLERISRWNFASCCNWNMGGKYEVCCFTRFMYLFSYH